MIKKWNNGIRLIAFLIVFTIVLCIVDTLFFSNHGVSNVWNVVQNKEKKIDILIMGNSHAYTSLDAETLSEAFGKNVQVLGSPSQHMVETYENLKIVLKYQKPDYIILEANSSIVDSREALQTVKRGFLMENFDGINNYLYKFGAVCKTFTWDTIPEGMFQLFRPTNMWSRWKFDSNYWNRHDTHGYQGTITYAQSLLTVEEIQKQCSSYAGENLKLLPDYNRDALEKFLQMTEKEGVNVWICKTPTMNTSLSRRMKEIEEICVDYSNVEYVEDMHLHMTDMGLETEDFYDAGHMNRRGAEKFTYYYGNLMAERMDIEVDWGEAFTYKTEFVEKTKENGFSYTIENYSDDCLYKFQLYLNEEVVDTQDYSENNVYNSKYDAKASSEYELYCSMIPACDAELGDKSENCIKVLFMKENECIIGKKEE